MFRLNKISTWRMLNRMDHKKRNHRIKYLKIRIFCTYKTIYLLTLSWTVRHLSLIYKSIKIKKIIKKVIKYLHSRIGFNLEDKKCLRFFILYRHIKKQINLDWKKFGMPCCFKLVKCKSKTLLYKNWSIK